MCRPEFANLHTGREVGRDHLWIPLRADVIAEDRLDPFEWHSDAIQAIAPHRIVRIGHRNDPCHQRNLCSLQTIGIAAPIERLVVASHARQNPFEIGQAGQDMTADLRVLLDLLEFVVVET